MTLKSSPARWRKVLQDQGRAKLFSRRVVCGAYDLGSLVGHRVHWSGPAEQSEAVAEVSPPKPKCCWVLTGLVVRYHIGDVRYQGTYPDAMVGCRGIAIQLERALMQEAAAERPRS